MRRKREAVVGLENMVNTGKPRTILHTYFTSFFPFLEIQLASKKRERCLQNLFPRDSECHSCVGYK